MNRRTKPYTGRSITEFLKALGAIAFFISMYYATVGLMALCGVL